MLVVVYGSRDSRRTAYYHERCKADLRHDGGLLEQVETVLMLGVIVGSALLPDC